MRGRIGAAEVDRRVLSLLVAGPAYEPYARRRLDDRHLVDDPTALKEFYERLDAFCDHPFWFYIKEEVPVSRDAAPTIHLGARGENHPGYVAFVAAEKRRVANRAAMMAQG